MKVVKNNGSALTEYEVSIIRNLLTRGAFENQDIFRLISSVRRLECKKEFSPGRISEVKHNHKRYDGIEKSSDEIANQFINRADSSLRFNEDNISPISETRIRAIFAINQNSDNMLEITETDKIECKQSFQEQHFLKHCIKAMVAFANNKGGYIAFGVKDKTWEILGINGEKFNSCERRQISQYLHSNLSCVIDLEMRAFKFGSRSIGIIYVHPSKIKPVILIKRNEEANTTEGHIYYRYHGENRLIGSAELQALIEERMKSLTETVLTKHLKNILDNGIENSAILNLNTGEVDGKSGNFIIDESILPKVSFIKEGEFIEKSGTPTLRLIGDIQKSGKILSKNGENLVNLYPFSWKEMANHVEQQLGFSAKNKINILIRSENIKFKSEYAAYNFRNKNQQDEYKKNGKLPKGIPSIYNQAAIDFIVDKILN